MPPLETTPHINVGPPEIDLISFIGDILEKLASWFPALFAAAQTVFGLLVMISIPLSVFFLIGIIYCVEQLKHIRAKEEDIFDTKTEPAYQEVAGADKALGHQWESVVRHIESPNQNDWKQAIMEADMILDDILTGMGYRGESIGDKLKRVVPGDMRTLGDAWEAHKVRNRIAHEAGFSLGQHEAKTTIGLYRKVFEEFYYI